MSERLSQRGPNDELEAWLAGMLATDGSLVIERGRPMAVSLPQSTAKARLPMEILAARYDRHLCRSRGTSNYGPYDKLIIQLRVIPFAWVTSVPPLRPDLERHYVRGLIDGDGSVSRTGKYVTLSFYWRYGQEFLHDFL